MTDDHLNIFFGFESFTHTTRLSPLLKHKVTVRRNGHFAFSSFARTGTLCWLIFQVRLPPKRCVNIDERSKALANSA